MKGFVLGVILFASTAVAEEGEIPYHDDYMSDARVVTCIEDNLQKNLRENNVTDEYIALIFRIIIEEICVETYFMIDNQIKMEGIPV